MSSIALVTGSTGLMGNVLVHKLIAQGRSVRALVRSTDQARKVLPSSCELVSGDITKANSVLHAMEGCSAVYHAAGIPEQWLADPSLFKKVNIEGTQNVIDAAAKVKIGKVIYISTVDLFQATPGRSYDETAVDPVLRGSPYRQSKQEADQLVGKSLERGVPAVFIHPSAIYGYSPAKSFWFATLIRDIGKRKMPFALPGGLPFVFHEDVALGCILAEKEGPAGERYILDESYYPFLEVYRIITQELGVQQDFKVLPVTMARLFAQTGELISRFTRRPPLLQAAILRFMLSQNTPDSSKARRELHWTPTPLREGIRKTIATLREKRLL